MAHRPGIIFIAALLLALLVRWPYLTLAGLDLDEATSAHIARDAPAVIWTAAQEDIHPPLYYLLLHPFTQLDVGDPLTKEWPYRLLSLLAGLGIAGCLWGMGTLLERPAAQRWSLWWFALSPFAVLYTTYARSFALVTLFAALAAWSALRWWHDASAKQPVPWWIPLSFAVAIGAGCWTFYFALPYALALLAVGAWWLKGDVRQLRLWLLSGSAGLAAFLPWVPVVLRQRGMLDAGDQAVRPDQLPFADLALQLGRNLAQIPNNLLTFQWPVPDLLAVALWLAALWLIVRDLRAPEGGSAQPLRRALASVFVLALVLILVLFLPRNIWLQERYTFLLLPIGWLLLEAALDHLRLLARTIVLSAMVLLSGMALGFTLPLVQEDFRGAAALLAEQAEPGEPVIVVAGFCTIPLEHYWPGGAAHCLPYNSFDRANADQLRQLSGRLDALVRVSGIRQVWLVISHDQRGRASRGGATLRELLTHHLGEPTLQRFHAVEVYRYGVGTER